MKMGARAFKGAKQVQGAHAWGWTVQCTADPSGVKDGLGRMAHSPCRPRIWPRSKHGVRGL
jgi:hypothetical protein